jgi:hypothetical protein
MDIDMRGTGLAAVLLLLVACGEKRVETPEDLQKSFEATKNAIVNSNTPPEVKAMVDLAANALKNNDEVAAVGALQALRETPNLTVDQRGAVQDMMAKAQGELAQRAARGDQQAIAALKMLRMNPR